jgi:uncharacterized membrane protein
VDPQAPSPPPLAVQCQLHPGQPFTSVCQRCGTYMCAVCSDHGRHVQCAACRERTGLGTFPFTRNSYTFSALFDWSWSAYKKHWLVMLLGVLVSYGILMGLGIVAGVVGLLFKDVLWLSIVWQVVTSIPQFFIQGLMTLGLANMAVKAVRGETPEVSDVFSIWPRIGPWLVQSLIVGALFLPAGALVAGAVFLMLSVAPDAAPFVGFGLGVLLLPFIIYALLGFAFGNLELVTQRIGAVAALQTSWNIARGHRWDIFLVGLASLAVMLAGFAACCVGVVFTLGLVQCLFASLYVALRNGAEDLRT